MTFPGESHDRSHQHHHVFSITKNNLDNQMQFTKNNITIYIVFQLQMLSIRYYASDIILYEIFDIMPTTQICSRGPVQLISWGKA